MPFMWAYRDQGCVLRNGSRVGLCIRHLGSKWPLHVGLQIEPHMDFAGGLYGSKKLLNQSIVDEGPGGTFQYML